jgi:hypothetical protein
MVGRLEHQESMIRLKNHPVLLDFPSQIEAGRDGPRKTTTECARSSAG